MNHLDEGTIHAWLDGALDATQARDIEAHVATCATCAAAVAEARGFIAGSSRILSALDDVPAGVTPRRAPVPARRRWRAAPWVTGIAAALMLAVGVTTWNRKGAEMASSPATVQHQPADIVPETALRAQSTPVPSAARPQPPAVIGTAAAPAPAPVVGAQGPAPKVAASTSQRQRRASDQRIAITDEVRTGAAGRGTTALAEVVTTGGAANEQKASVAIAEPRAAVAARDARIPLRPFGDSAQLRRDKEAAAALADAAAVTTAAGCYVLPRAQTDARELARKAEPAAGAVSGLTSGRAARSRASEAAPAAAPAAPADYTLSRRVSLLQLDTTRHALGYTARSDSGSGWWKPIGHDSVEVDLLTKGLYRFGVKDRVRCEGRE